jgi:hypothetical protein
MMRRINVAAGVIAWSVVLATASQAQQTSVSPVDAVILPIAAHATDHPETDEGGASLGQGELFRAGAKPEGWVAQAAAGAAATATGGLVDAPLTTLPPRQKFLLAARQSVDPLAIGESASKTVIYETTGFRRTFGVGLAGYSKQFSASMANGALRKMVGDAVFASLFHQDPRYVAEGRGPVAGRLGHALSRVFVGRRDSGEATFNSSLVLGSIAAAGVANAYYPSANRTLGKTANNAGWFLLGKGAGNVLHEFLPAVYHRLRKSS